MFQGEDAAETLAAVINKQPDLSRVPAKVRRLLERCLEKDPKKRLRDIGEVTAWLDGGAGSQPAAASQAASRMSVAWMAAAGVLLLALGATSWALFRATRPAELKPLVRLDVDLGSDVSLSSFEGTDTIFSPDGTRLVYGSQGRLFTRKLDQPKATELAGTEGAYAPFFSPDGLWVAFFAQNKLKKISVEGGAAITLCDAVSGRGGSWGEDGNIIASLNNMGVLTRIPAAGGSPVALTELAQGEVTHRWPQILPGAKAVLFTANASVSTIDSANIEVMSLPGQGKAGRRKTLVREGTFGRYLATSKGAGHLVYVNRGTLFAVPFDLDKLETRGTPSPVLDGIAYAATDGFAEFDASPSGTLLYRSGGEGGGGLVTVQWLDGTGKTQPLLAKPDAYMFPRLSPDGERLAISTSDVWVYEWRRDTMTRLTFSGGNAPVWSPDGRAIIFRKIGEGLFWTRSDGAGKPQPLTQSKYQQSPYSFAPDGKRLVFQQFAADAGLHLWTVPLESDGAGPRAGKPEAFLQTPFSERSPSFSSDGRWLAYASDESGSYQVYVRAFPDKGGKLQVSNSGGLFPVFSHNGKDLFFRTEDNRIMVANYTVKGDSFVADKPRVWSEKRIANTGLNYGINYDVAPDGKRIAALMRVETPEGQQAQSHVIFLENFFDELRRKVPVSGK